jgi:hypothetical protein
MMTALTKLKATTSAIMSIFRVKVIAGPPGLTEAQR